MSVYEFGSTPPLATFRSDVEERHTPIALYDPDSPDLQLAISMAAEMTFVSGAEVQVYVRTDNADFDTVWDEDPDPTYWNAKNLKAFFKPSPLEVELKKWGVEASGLLKISFLRQEVVEEFGNRALRIGDVIKVPYNAALLKIGPANYRVENVGPTGNFRYDWLYLTCDCAVLTADVTVRPNDDLLAVDDGDLVAGGQFRESV